MLLAHMTFNRQRFHRVGMARLQNHINYAIDLIFFNHLAEHLQALIVRRNTGVEFYSKAIGAYRMQAHNEIITIVDKSEYQKLMAFVDKVDPNAFVTVYKVSEMQYMSKTLPERIFEN